MIDHTWFLTFFSTEIYFHPAGISDHSPLVATIFADPKIQKRFSFLNCWIGHTNYDSIVAHAWSKLGYGPPMYRLFVKLKNVKVALLALHKSAFLDITKRVQALKENLENCQITMSGSIDAEILDNVKSLLNQYCHMKKIEMSILSQKAKLTNMQLNDTNSAFLFSKIAERQ